MKRHENLNTIARPELSSQQQALVEALNSIPEQDMIYLEHDQGLNTQFEGQDWQVRVQQPFMQDDNERITDVKSSSGETAFYRIIDTDQRASWAPQIKRREENTWVEVSDDELDRVTNIINSAAEHRKEMLRGRGFSL